MDRMVRSGLPDGWLSRRRGLWPAGIGGGTRNGIWPWEARGRDNYGNGGLVPSHRVRACRQSFSISGELSWSPAGRDRGRWRVHQRV